MLKNRIDPMPRNIYSWSLANSDPCRVAVIMSVMAPSVPVSVRGHSYGG
jgi:hypothetical protein